MNILNKYTNRSLRLNRTRTLVTIVGILLSVCLITAVIEGAYSGQQYLIRVEQVSTGSYTGFYDDMDARQVQALQAMDGVAQSGTLEEVGYAQIGSENEYKPYLYIVAASGEMESLAAIHLTDGRMPENDSELLLPEHLYDNGNVRFFTGDTLTLSVGQRQSGGSRLRQNNPFVPGEETLEDTRQKTYTVVGFYERLHYTIEDFSAPGYTAITGGRGDGSFTAFFALKNPGKAFEFIDAAGFSNGYTLNSDLINLYGATANNYVATMLYGLAAVLVMLIMFGSVSLIYNSFSISVSERTKQFGILKSVGATKKQLTGAVLHEALALCIVAIPLGLAVGCLGIGITLHLLQGTFDSIIGVSGVKMQFCLTPAGLAVAAAVGLLTALISAWLPARRAVRRPAIESIRQSADIAIRSSQVRTSKLTYRLFGFEGLLASKNFKRNRKQYRATVLSLFMSLVLFISASSFSSYLRGSVGESMNTTACDLTYYTYADEDGQPMQDVSELFSLLGSVPGVTDAMYADIWNDTLELDRQLLSEEALAEMLADSGDASTFFSVHICFVDEAYFSRLLEENGLNPADYADRQSPLGLIYDHTNAILYEEDGARYANYDVLGTDVLPATLELIHSKPIDGYVQTETGYDEDGQLYYEYVNEEQLDSETGEISPEGVLRLPAQEAEIRTPLQIGARLSAQPLCGSESMSILYPAWAEQALMGRVLNAQNLYFTAENASPVYEEMTARLRESGYATSQLTNVAASFDSERAMMTVLDVFTYGFIILISLIAAANVFNTISNNIALRRREFAMLKSVGMTTASFHRMMNYECLLYGLKALLLGLPVSFAVTWLIYKSVANAFVTRFYVPWVSVVIGVCSIFAVVFVSMLYAMRKIRQENPIDALRNENL